MYCLRAISLQHPTFETYTHLRTAGNLVEKEL
jgi:hypothetical protein